MGYIFYISSLITWISNVSNLETFLDITRTREITIFGNL